MEWYLVGALVVAVGYAFLLRKNLESVRELNKNYSVEVTKLTKALVQREKRIVALDDQLAQYINIVANKKEIDKTKKGKELADETNNLLTQKDLFAPSNDSDPRSSVVKLPND